MMRKRAKLNLETPIVNIHNRELGHLSTRTFAHRLAASKDLVLRFDLLRKLNQHRGCVNTVSFNETGDVLVSGSDDRHVILWDWESGNVKLSFHSGHHNNVFQARFMPCTDDRTIVTCAADGQVRHAQILECGKVETKLLAKHQGRAHKLAVEPGSPHIFYTCGEDGLVQHIDLRSGTATGLFTCKPVESQSYLSTVHLNAITMDPRNPNLFAVGGSDQFARLYDIRKYNWDSSSALDRPVDFFCPSHLIDADHVGITGLAFSDQSELLVSYNDECIYLFTKDIGLGPDPSFTSEVSNDGDEDDMAGGDDRSSISHTETDAPQSYKGHRNCETVKGVNFFGPGSEYVVSGSDCGRIFIWKKKGGELVRVMEADKHVVNCIESHPHDTMLASSGIEKDIKIWIPKALDKANLPTNIRKGRIENLIRHRFGFYSFDGFYDDDDDDDFIDTDEDGDDDDDESDDDSDDDADGICANDDSITDNNDDFSGHEALNEEQLDEEHDEDENIDFVLHTETNDNDDVRSMEFFDDVNEPGGSVGGIENGVSDDSFIDICDIDDSSDLGSSDDFDDRV